MLVAVCDLDAGQGRDAPARRFGVPSYTDVGDDARAASGSTLVDIVTRQTRTARCARPTIGAGVAHDRAEALRADLGGLRRHRRGRRQRPASGFAVHENFRFQTPMRHVRAVIDSGAIGAPSWARITLPHRLRRLPHPALFPDEERLAIADVGIHVLDLARFFLGEVDRISCETQRAQPEGMRRRGHRDHAAAPRERRRQRRRMHLRGAPRSPTPSPRRCSRSRATRGSIVVDAGVPHDA